VTVPPNAKKEEDVGHQKTIFFTFTKSQGIIKNSSKPGYYGT